MIIRYSGVLLLLREGFERVACRRFSAAATERKARPDRALFSPAGHAHMLFCICLFFGQRKKKKENTVLVSPANLMNNRD